MKVSQVALVLGCSALLSEFAVQSKVLRFDNVVHAAPFVAQSTPPPTSSPEKPKKLGIDQTLALIKASAKKHKVPKTVVRSIVAAESNFNSEAVSPAGAIGLMQLMPDTAQEMGADPKIPAQNVDAGTRYLRVLMDRYSKRRDGLKHVIAAYNAGPANVDRYKGVPPFRETRSYVKRVMDNIREIEGTPKNIPITLATLAD